MAEKGFNGWKNYEGWVTKLWLDNDEGTYLYWREATSAAAEEAATCSQVLRGAWTAEEAARIILADRLKREIYDAAPDLGASLFADLLNAALSEVDWYEIADSLLDDHADDIATDSSSTKAGHNG